MILDRILKGFWGRYALYLSAFVALYFLMREKFDSIIFSLWDSWITVGVNQYISIFIACLLSCYPAYNLLSKRKKEDTISASPVVFIFIPISVWFIIQKVWTTDKAHYLEKDAAFQIILYFTIIYLIMLVLSHLNRHKAREAEPSLLLKDEPIKDENNDKLGFSLYAEPISKNICSIVNNKHSFVFGIEGSWGSGKTSFVNLVKEHLEKHSHIRQLDFNPWMSGSAQQMTTDFFSLMAENTSSMRLRMKFREYGNALASADGTGIVGKIIESISPSQDLVTMLESINECIVREQLRFVVFIDDTDRLDKEELLSVFKLVRNTANFSNTIFVLTYDRTYVDSLLTSYFENSSIAEAYTDKIVNLQFELPSSTNDYYEILRREINDSEFIKANPEIGLKDNDLPTTITNLFDSYRKIKRVFNALAVESGFPHFEKIPVKYTLVFFYMADYRKKEYEMIKEAYINYNNNKITYDFIDEDASKLPTIGKRLLQIIEHSNQVYKPKIEESKAITTTSVIKENEQEDRKYDKFKDVHSCIYTLLNDENNDAFTKYLEYLFKINAIHYKEYKVKYDKYGIDGYKNIKLELSDAKNILNRLIVIRDNFPKTFYESYSNEIGVHFITKLSNKVTKETFVEYCNILVALALNIIFFGYIKEAVNVILDLHAKYRIDKNSLPTILTQIDNLNGIEEYYVEYYKKYNESERYNRVTDFYKAFKAILIYRNNTLPFSEKELEEHQLSRLERAITSKQSYSVIKEILYTCESNDNFLPRAVDRFRRYLDTSKPEQFLVEFIQPSSNPRSTRISFNTGILKVFKTSREDAVSYFKSLKYEDKDLMFLREFILETIEDVLNEDNSLKHQEPFSITIEDINTIRDIRERYEAKINELVTY